jgi:dTDP-4-dehydrorhamnose reductase
MPENRPRLLVIGSRGFLGRHVVRAAGSEFVVIEGNRAGNDTVMIDIRSRDSVASAFGEFQPEIVLLLAAYADIDYCEQHPEEAWAVNFRGAEYVAEACARSGARFVFTSTGAVFDGLQHGYGEEDPVSPVSVYGKTKAEAEKMILARLPDAIIVRLALVIGFALPPGANGFLDKFAARLARGETVAFSEFEKRNPIDAKSCSEFVLELVKRQQRGIFNVGSSESISRYDLGLKLAARMGYPGRVQPELEPVAGRAPRGPDHFLLTDKLRATCDIPIPNVDEVIERCFDGIAESKI